MTPAEDLAIAELLAQSRAAHQLYRDHCAAMVPDGAGGVVPRAGNPLEARRYLSSACALRQAAEASDPLFASVAWQTEPSSHDHAALTAFYASQLATEIPVQLSVETLRAIAQREVFANPNGPEAREAQAETRARAVPSAEADA